MKTVVTIEELLSWVRLAEPLDRCCYHLGHLSQDRIGNLRLEEVASAVGVLSETGAVIACQGKASYGRIQLDTMLYSAVRTDAAINEDYLDQTITTDEMRALLAVNGKPYKLSSVRAVAVTLGLSEPLARSVCNEMIEHGLLQYDGGRIVVSEQGAQAIARR